MKKNKKKKRRNKNYQNTQTHLKSEVVLPAAAFLRDALSKNY